MKSFIGVIYMVEPIKTEYRAQSSMKPGKRWAMSHRKLEHEISVSVKKFKGCM
jgi:hypothetical protein